MIYCSYSRKDRPVVQRVCQALTEKGIQLFVDYEHLVGGDYAQELTKQIESAEAILFFYSKNTENSTWVKHEIEFALSKNKCIIPLILSEPEKCSWLNYYLGTYNWIQVDEEDVSHIADRIINACRALCHNNETASYGTIDGLDERGTPNTNQPNITKGVGGSKRKKIFVCGIIVTLGIVVFFILFTNSHVSTYCPAESPNLSINDTLECLNIDYGRREYLVELKQRNINLRRNVDEQLFVLRQEIETPHTSGYGNNSQSIIHEIEIILGEDSIPFPNINSNSRQEQLKAYYQYREEVYSILDRRIEELDRRIEEIEQEERDCQRNRLSLEK